MLDQFPPESRTNSHRNQWTNCAGIRMRRQRLFEACPFLAGPLCPAPQPAGFAQHPKHTGRAEATMSHRSSCRSGAGSLPAGTVPGSPGSLASPYPVARNHGNPAVMLVGLAVALAPVVKLAHAQLQPSQQSLDRRLVFSAQRRVKSTTASRTSGSTQQPFRVPQVLFLMRRAPPSTPPGLRPFAGSFSPVSRSAAAPDSAPATGCPAGPSRIQEQLLLPAVKHAGSQMRLLADLRDGDLLDQVAA